MAPPLRLVLIGATGRMGQSITACAKRGPDEWQIAAAPRRGDDLAAACASGDAVLDAALPEAAADVIAAARTARRPLVVGVTGHDDTQRALLAEAAREIPLLLASNFSVGVNALFWLVRRAAEILGPDFDLEIIETHHRLKKDSPSGTARRLAEVLAEARQLSYERDARHGRAGLVGPRAADEIGMHAVRGGDVVGEHTVLFAGVGERVELTHRASSRETFALGALRAAAWLVRQPAGRIYDMEDALGLRDASR